MTVGYVRNGKPVGVSRGTYRGYCALPLGHEKGDEGTNHKFDRSVAEPKEAVK
jgi:hypothetical protein